MRIRKNFMLKKTTNEKVIRWNFKLETWRIKTFWIFFLRFVWAQPSAEFMGKVEKDLQKIRNWLKKWKSMGQLDWLKSKPPLSSPKSFYKQIASPKGSESRKFLRVGDQTISAKNKQNLAPAILINTDQNSSFSSNFLSTPPPPDLGDEYLLA